MLATKYCRMKTLEFMLAVKNGVQPKVEDYKVGGNLLAASKET